ncbi:peptidylprolyl isomerase [Altererythrobacter luteolus]|uniref:Peptidyl-prolyl cis-trans isomerase n=1 Tax=Pontixanthobacter luteolus TaxID=295089 RepID=A0A6I4UZ51_9SPHN|nr:FKBP-type peptidyl-prolyl cis-trans isomerase [Pontixanthobacter luteolus]MXP47279.1 peptidylprolyl isomerase [Pontixanthobacter luteolus]
MTEVTRVPIHPIAKGSLTKLWIGIIVAVLIGAAIAWSAVPQGVSIETVSEGTGPTPQDGDVVFINYTGKLADGTVFDESQDPPIPEGIFPKGNPFPLEDGATIPGFAEGLKKMQKGGRYVLEIPAAQAYGAEPPAGSPIPANADLTFEIEVVDFMGRQDFEMRLQALQQMMQMQQQQGGPGGPAGPPSGPGAN